MEEIKRRADFFKELPLQKRLQAIEATRRDKGADSLKSRMGMSIDRCDILRGAFDWAESKQVGKYWVNINRKYFKN